MNLRDRLNRMFSEPAAATPQLRQRLQKLRPAGIDFRLAERLGGNWEYQDSGRFLSVIRDFPLQHVHGGIPLDQIFQIEPEMLCLLSGQESFQGFHPSQALFIDTETTGLSGGAGTYVFLVGLGYFHEDIFRLHQLFLPDLGSESAFLEELQRIAAPFRYLISFNGKSYDLNLLENRFILQRRSPPFTRFSHLDLLYPSRTLWKGSLESCALQSLERKLLGIYRQNDIQSSLIPRIYFSYLHTGRHREFPRIFEHNRLDLLTLLSIMAVASRLVEEPERSYFADPVSAARLCLNRGDSARAMALLESACQKEDWVSLGPSLRLELAFLKRRLGYSDEALTLYQEILQGETIPPLRAYEEAAKILEHDRRDLETAFQVVTEALQIYADSSGLQHRLHRLQCRLSGRRWY